MCCRKLGSSCQLSEESKVGKLIGTQAWFISETFSGKRTGLAGWGSGMGPGPLVLRTYIICCVRSYMLIWREKVVLTPPREAMIC